MMLPYFFDVVPEQIGIVLRKEGARHKMGTGRQGRLMMEVSESLRACAGGGNEKRITNDRRCGLFLL